MEGNSSDLLNAFWKPGGEAIDFANQARIIGWMAMHGLAHDTKQSLEDFIHSPLFEDERQVAIQDLLMSNQKKP